MATEFKKNVKDHPSMINATALSASKMALVKKFIAANGGNPLFHTKELTGLAATVTGRKYSPWWIYKNFATKVHGSNLRDLSRFKLSTKSTPAQEIVPETEPKQIEGPSVPAVTPSKGKREHARPKREAKKSKKETPINTEPLLIEGPETTETTETTETVNAETIE